MSFVQVPPEGGGTGAVGSVNGQTGAVVLTKSDVGLGSVPNTDATNPANIVQTSSFRFATDAEKATWNAKQDALGYTPVNKAGDTMSDQLTVTGSNGTEFAGIVTNNTNPAGFNVINARADDGEVIQIGALNSLGAGNAFGTWVANTFALWSARTLSIMAYADNAKINFNIGTSGKQIAQFDSDGKLYAGIDTIFGTAEDGDVTLSADTPLGRSTYYNNLTINSGGTLRPQGFDVRVRGTLTINPGGAITRDGNAGGNSTVSTAGAAGAALSANEFGGSAIGGAGAAGVVGVGAQAANVAAATCVVNATPGNGGAGGAGASGAGGSARNGNAATYRPQNIVPFGPSFLTSATAKNGGQSAPGGSSGAGDGTNTGGGGGGGGSGGGILIIFCNELINNGTIAARGGPGGNGGSPSAGNCGGGGGGAGATGGAVFIIANKVTTLGTILVTGGAGGTGGTKTGTGVNGSNGTAGGSGRYRVYEMSTGTWTIA